MSIKCQDHSLTLATVTQISKLKFVCLINSWAIIKIYTKAWGRIGMKIYTNELGHMTNMAVMPIYGKILKKSSSSAEPIDRCPWNFVCSIVYATTTKVVQIMTLGWPWYIFRQGQIWWHWLLYGKSDFFFFGNYCNLRSQSCLKHLTRWVNEVEWVSKVKIILWPWSKVTQISKLKLVFHRNSWIWNQSWYESLRENENENLYLWVWSHDQHGCHSHIW